MALDTPLQTRQYLSSIGSVALPTPILLAPMAGYSDLPFRMIVRELGGLGLAFTEMLHPQTVLQDRGKRSRDIMATSQEDRPLGHQIYGRDPQRLAETARHLEANGATLIDLNMGCPAKEITSGGGGSALLRDGDQALRVAEAVVNAVSIPVTVKLRLGWDEGSLVAVELARGLEGLGVAALTVHGRTRAQGYAGVVNLEGIRRVVEAVERIPVIGNGDLLSPEDALRMLRETGCQGLMVARGVMRDPWLIRDLWRGLCGLPPLPPSTLADHWDIFRAQFERMVLHYGEKMAPVLFRKWFPMRAEPLGLTREAMLRFLRITNLAEMRRALRNPPPANAIY